MVRRVVYPLFAQQVGDGLGHLVHALSSLDQVVQGVHVAVQGFKVTQGRNPGEREEEG